MSFTDPLGAHSPTVPSFQSKDLLEQVQGFVKVLKATKKPKTRKYEDDKIGDVAVEDTLAVPQIAKVGAQYFVDRGVKRRPALRAIDKAEKMVKRQRVPRIEKCKRPSAL